MSGRWSRALSTVQRQFFGNLVCIEVLVGAIAERAARPRDHNRVAVRFTPTTPYRLAVRSFDPATKLFTVVDLSTVWIVADLYEKDFARVRVGDHATVVTPAYPDRQIQGRVSYIDPQVSPESRTTKVRVEVSNPHYDLRLGMLAEAQIQASTSTSVAFIPRIAVQNVADRSFVYVAKPGAPGQFMEREVLVGQPSGERIQVVSGVVAGDKVVTEGSFFMRAERERLGLRP